MLKWNISTSLVDYSKALAAMEKHVNAIVEGTEDEMVWLLEHAPVITAGTSANDKDLLDRSRFPVYIAGRGGEYTYHGPGQRICYTMLDLKKRNMMDIKRYVFNLEQWIINCLAVYGICGERRDNRVGIWVDNNGHESKIAAIGIRVRKWVTYHGIAINISPDLSHYNSIVPCGISNFGVTSMAKLGHDVDLQEFNKTLQSEFTQVFGQ